MAKQNEEATSEDLVEKDDEKSDDVDEKTEGATEKTENADENPRKHRQEARR